MQTPDSDSEIVPATSEDTGLAAGVIAAAFHNLEAARWQIPDDDQRRAVLPAMFFDYVHHALGHGNVEITTDACAVAVWTVETGAPTPAPEPVSGRLRSALGEAAETVHLFDLALHARLPVGTPFEKLALLGVRPDRQNRGLGSALLAYHLAGLDRRLVPAYLEASSKASRELYLRFGFFDLGEPIKLPGGPLMYAMWREPLGVQAA